ncbi:IclR family transcriptional regulator [Paractinoplanes rhizophilus]|uniref:IclR family transcriptional regulator n=1 Tax=Paractinoplanes rhizophilus TaxID=1416877 RepID=A0ABW2I2S6_9ACTN|nr:IclR family transcriptional regulator [Actinoplanes sp.]
MTARGETGPVLRRATQLLTAFTPERPALTLTQLARRAGLPLTTTHRLVGELVHCGLLERDPAGEYRVGLRLWEIASLAPRGLGLRERALPYMEDLFAVTRENVQLAVREGGESVYVERLAGRHAVPVLTRVGGRFPLHPTGVGRVLLAHAPADVQESVLAGPLARFTPLTVTDPDALRKILADVRAHGFAVNDRQVTMDSLSVAAPIRAADGEVVAAVSIVVTAGTALPAALAPAVRATAQGITRALRT